MDERNETDLHNVAGIKTTADASLIEKVQTAQKVYWVAFILITLIASVAVWVTTIRRDVDTHDRSIRLIWESLYGTKLP